MHSKLVANCEQVVYSGVLELFHSKQLPAAAKNTDSSKSESKRCRSDRLTRGAADSAVHFLEVHHYKQPLSYCHIVFMLSFDTL